MPYCINDLRTKQRFFLDQLLQTSLQFLPSATSEAGPSEELPADVFLPEERIRS